MEECNHKWRQLHEQFHFGGSFQIGWECVECKKFVSNTEASLKGTILKSQRLIGPHGGYGYTSSGKLYKEQIIDEDGKLTIVEPQEVKHD